MSRFWDSGQRSHLYHDQEQVPQPGDCQPGSTAPGSGGTKQACSVPLELCPSGNTYYCPANPDKHQCSELPCGGARKACPSAYPAGTTWCPADTNSTMASQCEGGHCDVGPGLPAGEYLFDFRAANVSVEGQTFVEWFVEDYFFNAVDGADNDVVAGFYIDGAPSRPCACLPPICFSFPQSRISPTIMLLLCSYCDHNASVMLL
eukprot:SAG31_NODE_306_length_17979_cov_7.825447_2_plen_204_part_00